MVLILSSLAFFMLGYIVHNGQELAIAIGVIFTVITGITQGCFWYSECEDIEHIVMLKQDKDIYQRQADELLGEFKMYLAETYPNIEKSIFETMKPEAVTAYMIKYPELKSSETITKLVDLINTKKSKIYDCELKTTSAEKKRRIRKRYQFIWCLPILPKE